MILAGLVVAFEVAVFGALWLLVGRRLMRATRLARRPSRVRYDHGFITHILGDTNTPHRYDEDGNRVRDDER